MRYLATITGIVLMAISIYLTVSVSIIGFFMDLSVGHGHSFLMSLCVPLDCFDTGEFTGERERCQELIGENEKP